MVGKSYFVSKFVLKKVGEAVFLSLYYEFRDKTSAFYRRENGEKTQKLFISKQEQFSVK